MERDIYFSANDDMQHHGNTLNYGLVQREQLPEDGQVRPEHVAIDVI
jgi:hypothetical protein